MQCATPSSLPIFTAALDTVSTGNRDALRQTENNVTPEQSNHPVSNDLNTSYPDLDRIRDSTIMCENDLYEDESRADREIRHMNNDRLSENTLRNDSYDEVRIGCDEVRPDYLYAEVRRPERPAMHQVM